MSVYTVHDFYGALEIPRSATLKDVQAAYRRLALKHHPDKSGDDGAVFVNISHAFDVLSNAKVRAAYDRDEVEFSRKLGANQITFTLEQAHALFHNFFGTSNPFRAVEDGVSVQFEKDRPPPPAEDVRVDVECSLEDLFGGCTKNMSAPVTTRTSSSEVISTTRSILVKIERGWPDGTELRFPKEPNDLTGDIVFVVRLKPHSHLKWVGDDLLLQSDVLLLDALIGHTVSLTGADRHVLHIRIDEIVDANFKKVVKGQGMVKLNQDGVATQERGDLIISFNIIFPRSLDDLQKDLLKFALQFPVNLSDDHRRALNNALAGKIEKPKEEEE